MNYVNDTALKSRNNEKFLKTWYHSLYIHLKKSNYNYWIASGFFLCCLGTNSVTQAQVTSDNTTSTEVTTSDGTNFTITGGTQAQGNLFHSFSELSIPNGGEAFFTNVADIENIISRVTGSSISRIDGLIRANGNANLFLINPNGIIFGSNASLNIGGSFISSTADRLTFADGKFFSATDLQTQPVLTVSVPIGLQFGNTAREIKYQSVNSALLPEEPLSPRNGLQLKAGKTIAFIGGNISIEQGILLAPEGRIELGSVAANSFVKLTPFTTGWILGYDEVNNFRDIRLARTLVSPEGEQSIGDIRLIGRRVVVTNQSQVGGLNFGVSRGGHITIKASESVELSAGSSLNTASVSSGAAGDINISTQQLVVNQGSVVDSSSNGSGNSGHVYIYAPESVKIDGNGGRSYLSTKAAASGDAGELKVTTGKLTLLNGGQISSSTVGAGDGGSIFINASNSVEVGGKGKIDNGEVVKSGLFAETTTLPYYTATIGKGGILEINTGYLLVQDGGNISVASANSSTGQAGNLNINAVNFVEVTGIHSSLQASSDSPQSGGDLTIITDNLIVQDSAEVNVSSTNIGDAGNLQVQARNISLNNGGKLTARSNLGKGGGNIFLQGLNSLTLRSKSEVSTSAQGEGNGGDITITTNLLTALENSNITANATRGRGGSIRIKTQGLFLSPDSRIDASSDQGIDGVVEINRLENDPENALLTLPAEPVNISGLIAQGCSSGGGSIARRGSEFVVTGRGGLPPNPKEAIRSDVALADLGSPIQPEPTQAKVVTPTARNTSKLTELVEAQGWVIGSQGEVILTASAPNVTSSIPWMKSHSCHG